jgi:hypothetical protein
MGLTVADIVTDHRAYAAARARARSEMLPVRAVRRVKLGDMLLVEFENEQTLRYQVQEMVFTERLTDTAAVAHEIEVYGRLLPNSHTLTATLFIELDVLDTVREELARLDGVQDAFGLEIAGDMIRAEEIRGIDEDPDAPSETVSVHMLRFRMDDARRDAFRDPAVPVELVVDHPAYSESTPIVGETRLSLIADLALPSRA